MTGKEGLQRTREVKPPGKGVWIFRTWSTPGAGAGSQGAGRETRKPRSPPRGRALRAHFRCGPRIRERRNLLEEEFQSPGGNGSRSSPAGAESASPRAGPPGGGGGPQAGLQNRRSPGLPGAPMHLLADGSICTHWEQPRAHARTPRGPGGRLCLDQDFRPREVTSNGI